MKKLFLLAALLVLLASLFSSAFPDGLEFVSEKLGFAAKGNSSPALLADYKTPLIRTGYLSAAVSGMIGVAVILGVTRLIVMRLKERLNYHRPDHPVVQRELFWPQGKEESEEE